MNVVTRFAPSPTGFLHIGGARTALFNWLFARHHGGKFVLRIEDTDRARSTPEAEQAILDGLKWLGLDWDGDWVSQFARSNRHVEVVNELLAQGKAYKCYCSPEELTEMREAAKAVGKPMRYDGRWRDRDESEAPADIKPVIRIKAPLEGETVIEDAVQGTVRVDHSQLDDMVLLRSDGTPTYMLSVVVDDHDMGVTHVIRGDDHLTNAFRQISIYNAMGWEIPVFAHIPLIHGDDGAKLSKRHGALGVEAYRDMGYLPEAIRNHLLRLGWGHGDDEIISDAQAKEWFTLEGIGRSPSRFDFPRLDNLNAHYLREHSDEDLVRLISPLLEEKFEMKLNTTHEVRLKEGMAELKERAKTLIDLRDAAHFYARPRPLPIDEKAQKILDDVDEETLSALYTLLSNTEFTPETIESGIRTLAEEKGLKLGKMAQPLRAALTGTTTSPSIFHAAAILGQEECLGRLEDIMPPATAQKLTGK